MISRTIAANIELFNEALLSVYLNEVAKLFTIHKVQDTECALSALSIMLRQKKVLGSVKDKQELIEQWFSCAKTTIGEIKIAFLVSLEGLLERTSEDADEYAKFVYSLVGRMFNTEDIGGFLKYIGEFLVNPFPQETLVALHVLQGTVLFIK
jgi:hypothetical protein